ncbi:hypothetical protein HAX54_048966, partial [Datura stramonium]|nr:hypothetical protein [Datura stramonium]
MKHLSITWAYNCAQDQQLPSGCILVAYDFLQKLAKRITLTKKKVNVMMEQVKPWVKDDIDDAVRGIHRKFGSFELYLNEYLAEHPDVGSLRDEIGSLRSQ